ncbi:MAG: PTS sugar transporter subunit IIC [Christensenella sp.]|nr:PTS sugar transporter subunit IIC [Christensenella sp.]
MQKNSTAVLTIKKYAKRWFIDGMGAMALGLFSSLIIGLIISQLATIPALSVLNEFTGILSAKSPVVGAAIGVAIAYGLKNKPLVIFSSAATGAFGYSLGGPVGAYVAALVGAEIGRLVAGKTPVDIIISPIVTILAGCFVGWIVGPPMNTFMTWLGSVVNSATELAPLPMGIVVSIIVGMVLTLPISSAALCIMMDISGLAAGAAVAGCCANMIGFAVMSFKENGWGGFLAQGLGTSMLQVPNILRHPQIWIPPIIASAVVGPLSTCVFQMTNTATGAGMGTSGLVGQFGAWAAMNATVPAPLLIFEIALIQFILPAVITLAAAALLRKIGWIRPEYLKLPNFS